MTHDEALAAWEEAKAATRKAREAISEAKETLGEAQAHFNSCYDYERSVWLAVRDGLNPPPALVTAVKQSRKRRSQ